MRRKTLLLGLVMLILLAKPSDAAYTGESASHAINEAENVIRSMQEMKFGVTYANDTLNEAKALFAQERYMAAETVAKKVAEIKDTAVRVSGLIDIAEGRIYDLSLRGFDVTDAQQIFDSALAEFKIDNYAEAEKTINQLITTLDEMEASESIKRTGEAFSLDILPALLDYLWLIIVMFLLLLIAGLRMKNTYRKSRAMAKIRRLENEKNSLKEKLKEIQKNYFEKGSVSKMDYDVILEKNSRRLDGIKSELLALKEKAR